MELWIRNFWRCCGLECGSLEFWSGCEEHRKHRSRIGVLLIGCGVLGKKSGRVQGDKWSGRRGIWSAFGGCYTGLKFQGRLQGLFITWIMRVAAVGACQPRLHTHSHSMTATFRIGFSGSRWWPHRRRTMQVVQLLGRKNGDVLTALLKQVWSLVFSFESWVCFFYVS